jgi:hypothetical protein
MTQMPKPDELLLTTMNGSMVGGCELYISFYVHDEGIIPGNIPCTKHNNAKYVYASMHDTQCGHGTLSLVWHVYGTQ